MNRIHLITGISCAAFAFAALVSAFGIARADHSLNIIGLLAIDANIQGNAATSIGPIDGCARVEPGAQIDVDYVVDAIPADRALIGFELELRYNPDLLEVVAVKYDLMLAAVGTYQPFGGGQEGDGLTNELPDSDGSYRFVVLDTASTTELRDDAGNITQQEANVERGKGVLVRFTLRAKAAGIGEVGIGFDPPNGLYPLTLDTQNEVVVSDRIGSASLAIGQDCPAELIPPKIIDPPNTEEEIFGGTPPPGPPPVVPTPTPPDQTPTPAGQTPEGQTPAPVETDVDLIPCPTDLVSTPSPPPTATPDTGSPSSTPEGTEPPSPAESPAAALCTPAPEETDDIVEVDEGSDTGLLVGAVALLGLGTAAAGGGWYMFRRSRNGMA